VRRSEICGLQWHDPEFDNLWFSLKRGVVHNIGIPTEGRKVGKKKSRPTITKLKTAASRKGVPMTDDLATLLRIWRGQTPYPPTIIGYPLRRTSKANGPTIQPLRCAAGYSRLPLSWASKAHRLAYLPSLRRISIESIRGECEGGPGAASTCVKPDYSRCISTGRSVGEKRSVEAFLRPVCCA
jgi:integrase